MAKDSGGIEPALLARGATADAPKSMDLSSVCVNAGDGALAQLLRAAIERCGFAITDDASASTILVSDDVRRDAGLQRATTIEVTVARPRAAFHAVRNIVTLASNALILADSPDSIGEALRLCANGDVFISSRALVIASAFPPLSSRQDEMLALIAQGESTADVLQALNIARATARRDVRAIKQHLGVTGRASLTAKALSLGYPARCVD